MPKASKYWEERIMKMVNRKEILKKSITNDQGQIEQFSLVKEESEELSFFPGPNRMLTLLVADAKQLAAPKTVWIGAEEENPAPYVHWFTDLLSIRRKPKLLLLIAYKFVFDIKLHVYEVDLSKPVPAVKTRADVRKHAPVPLAAFNFKFIHPQDELVAAKLVPDGELIEVQGTYRRVNQRDRPIPIPFVLKYDLKSKRWEIPPEFAQKIEVIPEQFGSVQEQVQPTPK
jgi:hypothetical protein